MIQKLKNLTVKCDKDSYTTIKSGNLLKVRDPFQVFCETNISMGSTDSPRTRGVRFVESADGSWFDEGLVVDECDILLFLYAIKYKNFGKNWYDLHLLLKDKIILFPLIEKRLYKSIIFDIL